jgi:hypothetical protein
VTLKTTLTKAQVRFLESCRHGTARNVWPGSDTRVANTLARMGLVRVRADIANISEAGLAALRQALEESK